MIKDVPSKSTSPHQGTDKPGTPLSSSKDQAQSPSLEVVRADIVPIRTEPTEVAKERSPQSFDQIKKAYGDAELFALSFFHDGRSVTVKDLALNFASLAYNHLGDAMLLADK